MHRDDAWSGLLEIVRHARYFDTLTRRYRWYWAITRISLACSAIGAIAVILDWLDLSSTERALVPGVILIVIAIDLVLDFGKTSALLNSIRKDLFRIEQKYRSIWESNTDFEQLPMLLSHAEEAYARVDLSTNKKLMQRSWEDCVSVEGKRYDTPTN